MAPNRTEPTLWGVTLAHEELRKDLSAQIQLNEEHYQIINKKLDDFSSTFNDKFNAVWGVIKWAGSTGFMVIVALLGFLLTQQYNAMHDEQKVLSDKISIIMHK